MLRNKIQFNKHKNKKAQMMGQILMYVLAAIIFSFVLLYGYKAIKNFNEKSNQVALIELKTNLAASVKKVRTSESTKRNDFILPSGTERICFIDLEANLAKISQSDICTFGTDEYDPIICNSWKDGSKQNVFLVPHKLMGIYVGRIKFDSVEYPYGYACMEPKGNRVSVGIEGHGDSAYIFEW